MKTQKGIPIEDGIYFIRSDESERKWAMVVIRTMDIEGVHARTFYLFGNPNIYSVDMLTNLEYLGPFVPEEDVSDGN